MKRIKATGRVVECHPSAVRKGTYYVTVDLEGWGRVKYASTRNRREGEEVTLTDQKFRTSAEMIRWEEAKW